VANQAACTQHARKPDVNEDGKINVLDLIYVRNKLGTKCQ